MSARKRHGNRPPAPAREAGDRLDRLVREGAIVTAAWHLHELASDEEWHASPAETRDLRYAVVILLRVLAGTRPITPAENRPAQEGTR